MSEHVDDHFKKHIRACIVVFVALLVLTLLTVGIARVHLGHVGNIVAALVIATFKACLVGAYFMHLNAEKKTVYRVLAVTFFFFLGLMLLTLFSYYDELGI
jgi:cytochrome c oxidase subunit IV